MKILATFQIPITIEKNAIYQHRYKSKRNTRKYWLDRFIDEGLIDERKLQELSETLSLKKQFYGNYIKRYSFSSKHSQYGKNSCRQENNSDFLVMMCRARKCGFQPLFWLHMFCKNLMKNFLMFPRNNLINVIYA